MARVAEREVERLKEEVSLQRLVSLELVWAHRGPHGAYLYELAWDGDSQSDDGPHLAGLIDPDTLDPGECVVEESHVYAADRSGLSDHRSGAGRHPAGAWSAGGRGGLAAVGG